MFDLSYLRGLSKQIGNFLSSATGRVGDFPDVIRGALNPPKPTPEPISRNLSNEETLRKYGHIPAVAKALGKQIIPEGEKKTGGEEKKQMGSFTYKIPQPDGSTLTVKKDIPVSGQAKLADAIRGGFREWAGLQQQGLPDSRIPAISLAEEFANAVQRNPFLEQHPFLLPILSILETSGGQNMTYPNNILNWGVVPQQQGLFNPQSMQEVIQKAASGISSRFPQYEAFRQSGNFADLANVYAPPSENLTNDYIRNYLMLRKLFESQMQ